MHFQFSGEHFGPKFRLFYCIFNVGNFWQGPTVGPKGPYRFTRRHELKKVAHRTAIFLVSIIFWSKSYFTHFWRIFQCLIYTLWEAFLTIKFYLEDRSSTFEHSDWNICQHITTEIILHWQYSKENIPLKVISLHINCRCQVQSA